MYCSNCGNLCADNAALCEKCGTPLQNVASPSFNSQDLPQLPRPSFISCYCKAWQLYATFTGRARRAEYWYFMLANLIVMVLCQIILAVSPQSAVFVLALSTAYSLATCVPSLALSARRLHDVGKSGWYIVATLIPVVGWIWYLILVCTQGKAGDNEYGSDPKAM